MYMMKHTELQTGTPMSKVEELKAELMAMAGIPRLTDNQARVFMTAVDYWRKYRTWPTNKELAAIVLLSPGRVQQLIAVCVRKGLMVSNGKVRGLTLTELGAECYAVKSTGGVQSDLFGGEPTLM